MQNLGTRRWWALGAVTLAVLAAGLDSTILAVALPTLASAFGASESALQWFSSGYLLVMAAAMLPAGMLGDRFGRRRIMLISLALFGLGSAACALAPTSGAFLAARLALGLAGAGVIVLAVSALTVLFAPEERPKAVGIWAAANFLGLPLGPILGGWLLTHAWWGWVFLMNVPVAALALVATWAFVPESRAAVRPGLDPLGMAASIAGLVGMTFGLIRAGGAGWTAPSAVVPLVAGAVVLILFLLWERHLSRRPAGQPLVDPGLFRSASFTWGVVVSAIAALAMIGVLFAMPQYFQGVAGTDAMGSGLRLLPLVGGLIAGAVPADRVVGRLGRKVTVGLGCLVLALGLALGTGTSAGSGATSVGLWMAVVGAGMGLAMATAASAALAALSVEQSGIGSAVLQAVKNVGGPFGASLLGSVLHGTYLRHLPLAGLPAAAAQAAQSSVFGGVAVAGQLGSAGLLTAVRAAFVAGLTRVLSVSALVAIVAAVLALAFLPRTGRPGTGDVARARAAP